MNCSGAMQRKNYLIFVLSMLLIHISCSSEKHYSDEKILAKVGDRVITLEEFIHRAEYTPRPKYCNGNAAYDKRIILNSLIAEKLLAINAIESEYMQNKKFQNYIKGRQEQYMREFLFVKEGFEEDQLDDSDIQSMYKFAGRTYNIQYVSIENDKLAELDLSNNKSNVYNFFKQQADLNNINNIEISWEHEENPVILDAMFSKDLQKNQVIGPLRIEANFYVLMKITGWIDKAAVGEVNQQLRWIDVKEKLNFKKAVEKYEELTFNLMKDKKLELDPKTFFQVIDIVRQLYEISPKEKMEIYTKQNVDDPVIAEKSKSLDQIRNNSFLLINDQVWTVQDFFDAMNIHPLVFKKSINKNIDFAEKFKMAIVNLIEDKYLTEEAYNRGYHNSEIIKRKTQMWIDSFVANGEQNRYMEEKIANYSDSLKTVQVIENFLNPYIDELQKKYSDQVEINIDEFDKIQLTRINMVVVKRNSPYATVIPPFPQITTGSRLNYGKKMLN